MTTRKPNPPTPPKLGNLPVKLHQHEVDQVRAAAAAAGKSLSHYVRDRLHLPIPKRGRPWPAKPE